MKALIENLPPLNANTAMTMLLAGASALVAFDLFGQSLSPLLGQARLAPVPLANSVIKTLTGEGYAPAAHLMHYMAGLVAYPLGWMLIARPLAQRVMPSLHWLVSSTLYGVALWVFALYFMAHLVAGNPPFLNFGNITWVALVGHVVYAVVAAAVVQWRETGERIAYQPG
ncbi:hypothetical protein [Coralliovum pocilloporae]|uniref:hypothetical protein n=1 Tax=Coralliovum pocilloporae TaxID=3066369 RepID=UPI003307ADAF